MKISELNMFFDGWTNTVSLLVKKTNNGGVMKKIIVSIVFLTVSYSLSSQNFYEDSLVEMRAFYNCVDSIIYVSIKNKSDSTVILNNKSLCYFKNEEYYFSDISLFSIGVDITQPGSDDLMFLDRILPRSTSILAIMKEGNNVFIDTSNFNLSLEIHYFASPHFFIIQDGILNRKLFNVIKKEKFNIKVIKKNLKLDSMNNVIGNTIYFR